MSEEKSSGGYRDLIIGVVAAVTAIGAHLAPADTTAAEAGHKWAEAQSEHQAENAARNHRNIENMRKYLIRYVAAQEAQTEAMMEMIASNAPRGRARPRARRRLSAPPPPELSRAPRAAKSVTMEQMLHMDESELEHMAHDLEDVMDVEGLAEEFDDEGFDLPPED